MKNKKIFFIILIAILLIILIYLLSKADIILDKKEYMQGENINVTLIHFTPIYTYNEFEIYRFENKSWIPVIIKDDYFECMNKPECKTINLNEIEECPGIVLCDIEGRKIKDTIQFNWNQIYAQQEKSFQCKNTYGGVESRECVIFGQAPSGKYKISFLYSNLPVYYYRPLYLPRDAQKEFLIK